MTVTVCDVVDIRTNATIRLPAVLADGKATLSDATPVPWAALDWTCVIAPPPPPEGPGLTVMLNDWVEVCPRLSLSCSVKLLVPAVVGVPEMSPIDGEVAELVTEVPAGRLPETMDQTKGSVPPAV